MKRVRVRGGGVRQGGWNFSEDRDWAFRVKAESQTAATARTLRREKSGSYEYIHDRREHPPVMLGKVTEEEAKKLAEAFDALMGDET